MPAKLDTSIPAVKMAVYLLRPFGCARDVRVRMVCARSPCALQQNGVVVGHLLATRTKLAKNTFPDLFIYRAASLAH